MKISFVIPFHNEEKNAGPMIEQVAEYAKGQRWDFEIIPVNDRSTDKTKHVLETYAKRWKFVHPVNRQEDSEHLGNTMGKALILGTQKSSGNIIIWTMGDLADQPKTYGEIVKKINKGYDMVIGSRYMPGGSRGNLDPVKAFFSSFGTQIARFLFDVPSHDITNAFRGFRKEVLTKTKPISSGYAISPEFAIQAHLMCYKIGEVPTTYYNRIEGTSSFKLYRMIVSYLSVYKNLYIRSLFQKKQAKIP